MTLTPEQENILDAILEASNSVNELDKLVQDFISTIHPPNPEAIYEICKYYDSIKNDLSPDKLILVNGLCDLHQTNS